MAESAKARELEALYARIQADPSYRTARMGEAFVPGRGALGDRPIVFIGEAPGRDEERARSPFVGAAGQNLTALLAHIGLRRDQVFVTNLVKYRPFQPNGDNRAPSVGESRTALPYLREELAILQPGIVVCLGLSAAKALLDAPTLRMGEANGAFFNRDGLRFMVTYHPSPYNYKFADKRQAMESAFERLKAELNL